jgi:hypothetical protein
VENCPVNPVSRYFKRLAYDSPSPGGEGRDEGERYNISEMTRAADAENANYRHHVI